METSSLAREVVRFGVFEVDLRSGELHKAGLKVKLREQSFQILALLLERPGEVVTREELRQKLWPDGTFVDFDHSLNAAINRLREALDDPAEHPRFIETLPRRGYRFIYPVETPRRGVSAVAAVSPPPEAVAPVYDRRPMEKPAVRDRRYSARHLAALSAGAILAVVAVLITLNVGGLRDRLMVAVGARSSPGGMPMPKIESLAVLPLENLSGDPEQEYFADGMTDALITDLGQISALRVISRTSVMQYKGTKKQVPEIAKELNVDAVVEGAVHRAGDRVRITANLIHASTDRHLWAEAYDRDLRDVLTLQSDVARAICQQVQAKLTQPEQARLTRARPVNPEAHELYLRGVERRMQGDRKKALEYFQQAIVQDPNFARARLGVAENYRLLGHAVALGAAEAFGRARASARKALELDDSLAEAHVVLGDALWYSDWDWSGAEREYRRALEVNPNSEFAQGAYGRCLSLLGRNDEAIAEAKRVAEISPARPGSYYCLMEAYIRAHRYDEAFEQRERILRLDPKADPLEITAWAYRGKGMYQEAIAAFSSIREPYLSSPPLLAHLGHTYALAGKRAEADKIIRRLVERTANEGVGSYEVAVVYAGLGDHDRSLEWLEKAYKAHEKGCAYLKVDYPFDPLRSDPRFQDLLRRMNFPP